jgi:hypothetical protein
MDVLGEEVVVAKRVVIDAVEQGAMGNLHSSGEAPKAVPSIRKFFS